MKNPILDMFIKIIDTLSSIRNELTCCTISLADDRREIYQYMYNKN